jgi:hypothetical protein
MRPPLLILLAALVLAPSSGHAQPSSEQLEQYRAVALAGQEAFNGGDYAEARTRWLEAAQMLPNPRIYRLLGRAATALGDHVDAVRMLRLALTAPENGNPLTPDLRAELEGLLLPEALRRVGEIIVELEPAAAVVTIDDRPATLESGILLTTPGTHSLRASYPGYQSAEQSVEVRAGERATVQVVLSASEGGEPVDAPPTQPAATSEWRPGDIIWAGTAATVLGFVGGIVFGSLTLTEIANYDADPSNETASRLEAFAATADVFFGVAAVGGVLAIIGLATGGTATGSEAVPIDGGQLAVRF